MSLSKSDDWNLSAQWTINCVFIYQNIIVDPLGINQFNQSYIDFWLWIDE